jgi:DNA mismatch repair protein MSH5
MSFQTLETVRDGEELLFLYHLIEGHVKTSYASHIALQAGLPQELVKRGTEVSRTNHHSTSQSSTGTSQAWH